MIVTITMYYCSIKWYNVSIHWCYNISSQLKFLEIFYGNFNWLRVTIVLRIYTFFGFIPPRTNVLCTLALPYLCWRVWTAAISLCSMLKICSYFSTSFLYILHACWDLLLLYSMEQQLGKMVKKENYSTWCQRSFAIAFVKTIEEIFYWPEGHTSIWCTCYAKFCSLTSTLDNFKDFEIMDVTWNKTRLESTWSSEKGLDLKEENFLREVDFFLNNVAFSLKEVDFDLTFDFDLSLAWLLTLNWIWTLI